MTQRNFLLRRLGQSALVLLMVIILVFVILHVIPGNAALTRMGEHASRETLERTMEEQGLNRSVFEQFFRYLGDLFRGELGMSTSMGRSVGRLILTAWGNTLVLALGAAMVSWTLGLACGILSARWKDSVLDRLFMGFSLLGLSMPVFLVAMGLQYVLAYHLHWLPIAGTEDWRGFILPSLALGWNHAGSIARLVRSSLTDTLEEDYIDTALAKGRGKMGVLWFHALRNTFLPVVTMMAIQLSSLLSGVVITETVFSINGIGRLAVQAIGGRDAPLLQGTVLFSTILVILGSLASDLLCACLDPRTRKEVRPGGLS